MGESETANEFVTNCLA